MSRGCSRRPFPRISRTLGMLVVRVGESQSQYIKTKEEEKKNMYV
jgi:hypothetical protein